MDKRTVINKAGGRASTIEQPICADLAPKNVEKLNHYQIFTPTTQTTASPPLEPLLSDFLPNKQRKLKNTKKETNLHSPKGLGGLKPSPDLIRGDKTPQL